MPANSSAYFNGCIGRRNLKAPASAWPMCDGSSPATRPDLGRRQARRRGDGLFHVEKACRGGGSGLNRAWRSLRKTCASGGDSAISRLKYDPVLRKPSKHVLLVEDNDNDAELAMAVLGNCDPATGVDVVRGGEEALDYLHRRGTYATRPPRDPVVILLD